VAPQFRDRRFTIVGRVDLVVLEAPAQLAEESRIILYDQEFLSLLAHLDLRVPKRVSWCHAGKALWRVAITGESVSCDAPYVATRSTATIRDVT